MHILMINILMIIIFQITHHHQYNHQLHPRPHLQNHNNHYCHHPHRPHPHRPHPRYHHPYHHRHHKPHFMFIVTT